MTKLTIIINEKQANQPTEIHRWDDNGTKNEVEFMDKIQKAIVAQFDEGIVGHRFVTIPENKNN